MSIEDLADLIPSIGFGFDPEYDHCGFVVCIGEAEVMISEHTRLSPNDPGTYTLSGTTDPRMRVILPREKWDFIVDDVMCRCNTSLREDGMMRVDSMKGSTS